MIYACQKKALSIVFIALACLNVIALPAFATVSAPEIAHIEISTMDGDVIASFNSQEEFDAAFSMGVSPMYETCGSGLYWHGQYTYEIETPTLTSITYPDGTTGVVYATLVKVYCSSCDGLISQYLRY